MAGQDFFGIRLDTKKLEQDAEKARQAFETVGKEAEKQSSIIDKAFGGTTVSRQLEKDFKRIDKLSIDAFQGISTNAQRLMKEIQEDTLSLGNVEQVMSQLNKAYQDGSISQQEYINTAARLEVLHRNISTAIQENERALKAETQVIDKLADDSMLSLQAKVTSLTTSYMKLSEAQRNSLQGEQLLKNISEIQAKLNSAQVAMNKYGATANAQFNTLGFSIQQIARELPSLTISPQMFFLAISNNLPIFTDALAKAQKEFKALTASGKDAIPVWKQITKALFSWQTAISVLPTLLIVFGDDIANFFKRISGGTDDVEKTVTALNGLKQAISKGTADAQKEVVRLNLLYDATQDVTKSTNERMTAIKELKEEFPTYFKNLTDEEIMAGKAADSYERLSKSIIASANARAAEEMMIENSKKIWENQQKINDAYAQRAMLENEYAEAKQRIAEIEKTTADPTAIRGNQQLTAARQTATSIADQIAEIDKGIAEYRTSIYKLNKAQLELKDSINIEDLIFDSKGGKGGKEKTINNLKQYLNELLGLQEDNEERRIELTKTGTEKQLALINLRYKRQIEAVKKLQEDLKKAQGGKLTEEQQGIFNTAISGLQGMQKAETAAVQNKQIEAEKKAMLNYLAEYGDYWEKRKAIASKYQNEIAKATTEGDRLSLQAEMTNALAKLDDEAQKKTSIITKLFGDMATKSVAEMRKIADEAEQMLAFIEGGQYQKDNAFGITEEQFKVLLQSPDKLESIKNEIANVRNEADKAEPTFERIKSLLSEIFKTGGSEKNNLSSLLNELNGQINNVMQSVSFLSDTFSSLGDAFGSDVLSGIGEGLNVATSAVNSAMQGAQAGSIFGGIGAAAGAAIGVVSSLATSIAQIHDKKNEKRIQKLQDQIDVLTESYDDLGRSIEEAYSKDASKLINQQNELLEQQKILIQQQIREEEDKKKTDEARIKEWQQQIDDINEQLEENKQKAIDAIFGEDIQSAIYRFATSFTDAWAQGTDATESARDAVRQMMQQMVTESIKAAIQASSKMEDIRKKLQEFYADNILTGWEQDYIYNMAEQLQKELDAQFGWAENLFKDKTSTTQQASAGGFTTMSQDSADELNGRFTALYEVGLRVENQINIGNVNLEAAKNAAEQMRDITQNCYLELVEIRENTGAVVKPIQQMQKDMAEMKNVIKERL